MKYCSHCGNQLVDEAAVCPNCGCPTELWHGGGTVNPSSAPVGDKLSVLSIVGFVFAFLQPLVGLICSIIAYRMAITESSAKSKSFSKAGIIVSAVLLVLYVLLLIFLIALVGLDIAYGPQPVYPDTF